MKFADLMSFFKTFKIKYGKIFVIGIVGYLLLLVSFSLLNVFICWVSSLITGECFLLLPEPNLETYSDYRLVTLVFGTLIQLVVGVIVLGFLLD